MQQNKTGFIGCGVMGAAIIKGIIEDNIISPDSIWVYDLAAEKSAQLRKDYAINVAVDNCELFNECNIVFLAVKPADFKKLLKEIKPSCNQSHLLVSIAAGITTNYIEESLDEGSKVVRLMPNMPCLIGEGVIAIATGKNISGEDIEIVRILINGLGYNFEVAEKYMDVVTAVSGSGPGYVYLFLEALIDGGVGLGLDRQTATTIALQTVTGSAKMAQITGKSMNELKNNISSPGGTTIAALKVMEEKAFKGTVINAVNEAARRARELESS